MSHYLVIHIMDYFVIAAPSSLSSSSSSMIHTHPLDLHEIRSRIASNLGLHDLASCTRVSPEWNDSFTPRLYHSIVLSKDGPNMESVNRNKHHIRHLVIERSVYEELPSPGARGEMVSNIMANSTLATLNLAGNSIGGSGAQALADALKTNTTLTTLILWNN